MSARVSSQSVRAAAAAQSPMPTRTSRWPSIPARQVSTNSSAADQQGAAQRRRGHAEAADSVAAAGADPPASTIDRNRPDRGALGDAEDVGGGQRVAGEGLEQRAGQAEGRADQRADDDPRRPQLEHDEGLRRRRRADQRAQHVADADRVVAAAQARPRRRAPGRRRRRPGPAPAASGAGPTAAPGGRPAGGAPVDTGAHSRGHPAAPDERDEERRPEQGQHDAGLQLARPGHDPAHHVGGEQQHRRRAAPSRGSASGGRGR